MSEDKFREEVPEGSGPTSCLILGATGATGKQVLNEVLSRPQWKRVVTIGRRAPPGVESEKLESIVCDVGDDQVEVDVEQLKGIQVFFNCIGTTRSAAGGAEGFQKIEQGISEKVAKAAKDAGTFTHAAVVSAQGANPDRSFAPSWFHPLFYGKVIGLKERTLIDKKFPSTSIFRPGALNRGATDRTLESLVVKCVPSITLDVKFLAKAMVNDAERTSTTLSTDGEAQQAPKIFSGNPFIDQYGKL